jgi:hypothetical protein
MHETAKLLGIPRIFGWEKHVYRLIPLLAVLLFASCNNWDRLTSEQKTIGNILQIQRAESRFRQLHGRFGSLRELGPTNDNLIERGIASGVSSGYRIAIVNRGDAYAVIARPLNWGRDGRRSFYSDQTGVIRQNWTDRAANQESDVLK